MVSTLECELQVCVVWKVLSRNVHFIVIWVVRVFVMFWWLCGGLMVLMLKVTNSSSRSVWSSFSFSRMVMLFYDGVMMLGANDGLNTFMF